MIYSTRRTRARDSKISRGVRVCVCVCVLSSTFSALHLATHAYFPLGITNTHSP